MLQKQSESTEFVWYEIRAGFSFPQFIGVQRTVHKSLCTLLLLVFTLCRILILFPLQFICNVSLHPYMLLSFFLFFSFLNSHIETRFWCFCCCSYLIHLEKETGTAYISGNLSICDDVHGEGPGNLTTQTGFTDTIWWKANIYAGVFFSPLIGNWIKCFNTFS